MDSSNFIICTDATTKKHLNERRGEKKDGGGAHGAHGGMQAGGGRKSDFETRNLAVIETKKRTPLCTDFTFSKIM